MINYLKNKNTRYYELNQTCQGSEMKMRETVRHSGEGAIFSGGGGTACDAAFV